MTTNTVGTIARRFNVGVHQIEYIVKARSIRPAGRAGIANVYGREAVRRIGRELRKIARDHD